MAEVETKPTGKRGRKAAMKAAEPDETPDSSQDRQTRKDPIPKAMTFFQRVESISLADWGSRAKITVYRLEPLINALIGSEKKYIKVYTQPPVTEERIKQDCGSGRYRLYLNFKAPAQNDREVDSIEIDILDQNFPPKIPKGSWLEDPRNAHWAWAKEKYDQQQAPAAPVQQQANPTETLMDAVELVDRLRPQTDTVKTTLDTIRSVRELMPQPPPPSNTDGTVLQMLQTFMQNQLAASREETKELREELRHLRDGKPAGDGTGMSAIREAVGGLKELLPAVKEIFPGLGEGIGGKSKMGAWQEFTVQMAPHATQILSPFAQLFAAAMMAKMSPQAAAGMAGVPQTAMQPAGPGLPSATPGAPGVPGSMMPFLQMIAMPMINKIRLSAPPDSVDPKELGEEFGLWVFEGFAANPNYAQAMLAVQSMGPAGLIAALRSTPVWMDKGPQNIFPSLAELEPKLPAFFAAFLAWKPDDDDHESDDEPEPSDLATPQVIKTFREPDGVGAY